MRDLYDQRKVVGILPRVNVTPQVQGRSQVGSRLPASHLLNALFVCAMMAAVENQPHLDALWYFSRRCSLAVWYGAGRIVFAQW